MLLLLTAAFVLVFESFVRKAASFQIFPAMKYKQGKRLSAKLEQIIKDSKVCTR